MNVAYVSDTTIGLSPAQALAQGVHLVPQQVIIEGRSLRDFVEVAPAQVAEAQKAGKRVSTSQINPADLEAIYQNLLQKFDWIVSVHASSKLSGTVASAEMVAKRFAGKVKVIDSLTLNGGLSFVIGECRKKLAEGVSMEGLEAAISPLRAKVRGLALPATLEYLHRGGRISGLQHMLGSFLKMLPIIEVSDGLARPTERLRGWHRGLERLAELLRKYYPEGARVVIAHADKPEAVEPLQKLIASEGVVVEDVRACGPAVSAHTGPGTIALFAAPH